MAAAGFSREMWEQIGDFGVAPPPPGVTPNFAHPQLIGHHSITISCSISLGMLAIASTLRFWANTRFAKKTSSDDYFYCVSLVLMVFLLSAYIFVDHAGNHGHHSWDFQIKSFTKPFLTITWVHSIILPIATWCIKTTLFCLLLTAFSPIDWLRTCCYVGIAVTFVFYSISFVIALVTCRPRDGTDRIAFLMGMASNSCDGPNSVVQEFSVATGVFNVLSDLYILIIPLPAVAKLKLPRKKKIGVFLIFSTGGLGCVASILTLAFRIELLKTSDFFATAQRPMSTNMLELAIGLTVSCIPLAAKLCRHYCGNWLPSLLGSSAKTSEPYQRIEAPEAKRKHTPGGLSEIDTMKTFGTTTNEKDVEPEHPMQLHFLTTPDRF